MNRFALMLLLQSCCAGTFSTTLLAFSPIAYPVLNPGPDRRITLADTIPPTINCPPSITFSIASSDCDTVYTYTVTADDDEPGVILAKVNGINSGQPFPIGTTLNLYLAIDAAGNTASCSFSVTINPPPASGFACDDLVLLTLNNSCMRQMVAGDILLPPFVCPGGFIMEVDRVAPLGNGPWEPALFGPSDLGKTYQARATHQTSGNKCWGNVKLVDSLPPVLSCPTLEISCAVPFDQLAPVFLKDSLGLVAGMPLVAENCPGNPVLNFSDISVNLPCDTPGHVTGYIKRTWMAVDASGNSSTCVQTINRVRSINNVIYPADITVSCADPNTTLEITGGPSVSAGTRQYSLLTAPFCEIDAFYDDSTELLCGGSWRIHRLWTVEDACLPTGAGNPVSGVQLIDVLDLEGPVFQCPSDTVIVLLTDSCRATLDIPDLIVRDDCSTVEQIQAFWTIDGLTESLTGTLGDFAGNDPASSDTLAVLGETLDFPVGATTILYVATDVCGNTASCEMLLQLWDSLPQVAVCDSFLTVALDISGQAILPAEVPAANSTDACGPLFFKIRRSGSNICYPDSTFFDDRIVFCCAEAGDTLPIMVRLYDVPVPSGPTALSFAAGQFTDCSLPVLVQDTLGPVCTAPADVTIDCDAFDQNLAVYGHPNTSCRADSIAEMLDYAMFDSSCTQGVISRTFQVFDTKTGASSVCTQKLELSSQQHYYLRFPDDLFVTTCDGSGIFGEPAFFGTACENMAVTFTDEIFTVVPDACYKIERTWKIWNACTYDSSKALVTIPNPSPNATSNHSSNLPGPIVSAPGTAAPWAATVIKISPTAPQPTDFSDFWSADANGYQYKQIIKIIDSQKPVLSNCPAGLQTLTDNSTNDPQFWNESYWYNSSVGSQDLCEGTVDLCLTMTDLCSGADVTAWYLLFMDLDNDGVQETVVSSTNLPGFNNIQFGNASNPNYAGGQPRAFDERPVLANQKYGFALQMTTQGNNKTACVRWNTQQNPLAYTVPQLPQGTHRIRWIIIDKCGNEAICETVFTIADGTGACGNPAITVAGNIRNEVGVGISDVEVQLDVTPSVLAPFTLYTDTDDQGKYSFQVGSKDAYKITPRRNDNYLNGVSTLDLVLINKHVLGLEPLSTPFKIIAADANSSRSVSTFDIIELRKLILGIYTDLPNSPSWRFVDAGYSLPNPSNPFQTILPETINASSPHPLSPMHNFTGAKVGDVNGNAVPNIAVPEVLERSTTALVFDVPEREYRTGEVFTVPVHTAMPVSGFQFSLNYEGLELQQVAPGAGVGEEHFAVFPAEHRLAASWAEGGLAGFELRFRARQAGRLSETLHFSNQFVRAEAYRQGSDGQFETLSLALRFDGREKQSTGIQLFQNQPNPFAGTTSIGFYLPEAATATLRVFDGFGRECYAHRAFYSGGLHTVVLDREMLVFGAGVYCYLLETDRERVMRKMVVLR